MLFDFDVVSVPAPDIFSSVEERESYTAARAYGFSHADALNALDTGPTAYFSPDGGGAES